MMKRGKLVQKSSNRSKVEPSCTKSCLAGLSPNQPVSPYNTTVMKSLKALIAALALGVVAAPLAHAQQKKGQMTPEQQIERIEQAVGSLSAEQKSKITDIIAKGREEMQSVPKEERKEK